jgi:hypothetical protein
MKMTPLEVNNEIEYNCNISTGSGNLKTGNSLYLEKGLVMNLQPKRIKRFS